MEPKVIVESLEPEVAVTVDDPKAAQPNPPIFKRTTSHPAESDRAVEKIL